MMDDELGFYVPSTVFQSFQDDFGIMSQYDTTFDLKINVVTDLITRCSNFTLYIEDCLIFEHHTLGLWVSIKYL